MADDNNTQVMVRRERVPVHSAVAIMDTAKFEHMGRIATLMAQSGMMPESLTTTGTKNNLTYLPPEVITARAFLIVAQAERWGMDPLAVMGSCSFVKGNLMYEGKLVYAVLQALLGIRLKFELGAWDPKRYRVKLGVEEPGDDSLGVVVSGQFPGEPSPVTIEGYVGGWRTSGEGSPWLSPANWRRQLRYRGTREWVNAYEPGILLGVLTDDDIDAMIARSIQIEQRASAPVPTLADAFGSASASKVIRQETESTAATEGTTEDPKSDAPSAEQASPTKESATPASGNSAEASPGQQTSSAPATSGSATADVVDFPGDKRQTAKEETKADPRSDFDRFAKGLADLESWFAICRALTAFRKTGAYENAEPSLQKDAELQAYKRVLEVEGPKWDPEARAKEDPDFYEIWTLAADTLRIRPVLRVLIKSPAYQALIKAQDDPRLDRIAAYTEAAESA